MRFWSIIVVAGFMALALFAGDVDAGCKGGGAGRFRIFARIAARREARQGGGSSSEQQPEQAPTTTMTRGGCSGGTCR